MADNKKRKPFLSVAVFILAAFCAIWLHLPAAAHTTPFSRGTYAILPKAEAALSAGHYTEALSLFRAAFVRALNEGQYGVAERIHTRTALAGVKLAAVRPDAAWPFFETYALLSTNFAPSALASENFFLALPKQPKTSFEYNLLDKNGRTAWGYAVRVDWATLWSLQRRFLPVFLQKRLSRLYLMWKSDWPRARFAVDVPISLGRTRSLFPWKGVVKSTDRNIIHCLYHEGGRWTTAKETTGSGWIIEKVMARRNASLNRLALFFNRLPVPSHLSVTLVHSYNPL